jgi:hypothetical protein
MFEEKIVVAPDHDFDVVIKFPGGKNLTIQARPSNADINYNGSLDIILPDDDNVTCWRGDDMEPSVQVGNRPEVRLAKQLVMELPGADRELEPETKSPVFTKDQILFFTKQILYGVIDRVESTYCSGDSDIDDEDRINYANGALEGAAMSLSCLYAQTKGEGMGILDWAGSDELMSLVNWMLKKKVDQTLYQVKIKVDLIAQEFADAWETD